MTHKLQNLCRHFRAVPSSHTEPALISSSFMVGVPPHSPLRYTELSRTVPNLQLIVLTIQPTTTQGNPPSSSGRSEVRPGARRLAHSVVASAAAASFCSSGGAPRSPGRRRRTEFGASRPCDESEPVVRQDSRCAAVTHCI